MTNNLSARAMKIKVRIPQAVAATVAFWSPALAALFVVGFLAASALIAVSLVAHDHLGAWTAAGAATICGWFIYQGAGQPLDDDDGGQR